MTRGACPLTALILLLIPDRARCSSTGDTAPGINPDWPAGSSKRGEVVTSPGGVSYMLLGVGYCRGGPPGGVVATGMVSYVQIGGAEAPTSAMCFTVCDGLVRCTGVELRNSNDWCELQVPALARTGNGTRKDVTDWLTGPDEAAEKNLTAGWDSINAVVGSPAALTTAKPRSGFYCWRKVVSCGEVPSASCEASGRYPCEESYVSNSCGPCLPLHVAMDSSYTRLPGNASSPCAPDPNVTLPTLKVSLASPWYGGKFHDEALYLAIIYGVRKAWNDRAGQALIPIALSKRMDFPFNITGHTETWAYTLSGEQLKALGLSSEFDTRIENHPMSAIRSMASLKADAYTTQYRLMEPLDGERTRPHCIIGSTSHNSLSGVFAHSNTDLPISHVATFYETPVIGWWYQGKEFTDKAIHPYYVRVNRVGLDYHLPLSMLIQNFGYIRVGVVTSGVNRQLVPGLKEHLGSSVELIVEDMNLQNACSDATFSFNCHSQLISALERLKSKDVRIIIHELDGMTHLDNYWSAFVGLFNEKTLYIQFNVLGDCKTPMIPPTDGSHGVDMMWEHMRKASHGNNRGEWDKMPGDCRVCPNFAFRDLPREALLNRTRVMEHNLARIESIYSWSSYCPEMPSLEALMSCSWCDPLADFWISPTCSDELDAMRTQLRGTLCIGVTDDDNTTMIDTWADYLGNLTAEELVASGAPKSFFDIFEPPHPVFNTSGMRLVDKWRGPWRSMLKEKAALLDAMLLALVAFNTWVRAAGDSMPSLSATGLRTGFRTTHNTAIPNWLRTIQGSKFHGLTGPVKFNGNSERLTDYMIYSAQGDNLAFQPVARYDVVAHNVEFLAPVVFNSGNTTAPPDREPDCQPGHQYLISARGCVACERGFYCVGERHLAIPCSPGTVSPNIAQTQCLKCPSGTVPNAGAIACVACPQGRHTEEEGSAECTACAAGRHWKEEEEEATTGEVDLMLPGWSNRSSCEPCAKGRYQEARAATACGRCEGGRDTFSSGAASRMDCMCPVGTYLPVVGESCLNCPEGMECNIGSDVANFAANGTTATVVGGTGNFPRLLPQFWASEEDPLSVYLCLDESMCPGGAPSTCGENTMGLMCTACREGYYHAGNRCVKCTNLELSHVVFPVAPMVLSPFGILLLYAASKTPVDKWSSPKNGILVCCVIIIIHFQIIGLLWQCNLFFHKNLGKTWREISHLNDGFALFHPSCAGFGAFGERYYLNVAWPLLALAYFVGTFLLSRAANVGGSVLNQSSLVVRFLKQRMDGNHLFSCYGSVMEVFFIGIAAQSFALFHCYEHPNGKESLHVAPGILCDSSERNSLIVVAVIAIIVYVGFGSVLLTWVLIQAPWNFQRACFRTRWRFLLNKYRPNIWWWSAVVLCRSLALNLCVVVLSVAAHQLIWISIALGTYGIFAYSMQPWLHMHANRMDSLICAILLSVTMAMLRFAANPVDQDQVHDLAETVSNVVQALTFLPCGPLVLVIITFAYWHLQPRRRKTIIDSMVLDLQSMCQVLVNADTEKISYVLSVLGEYDRHVMQGLLDLLVSEGIGDHGGMDVKWKAPTRVSITPIVLNAQNHAKLPTLVQQQRNLWCSPDLGIKGPHLEHADIRVSADRTDNDISSAGLPHPSEINFDPFTSDSLSLDWEPPAEQYHRYASRSSTSLSLGTSVGASSYKA